MGENEISVYDPAVLAKVSALKLRARGLVEGILSGQHRSRHRGASVEFAEYKDYTPGDEIKHIDWKAVGKTDKYHVKQFEQSTNLKCTILLDASGSMAYESPIPNSPGLRKIDYARTLTAALAYLVLRQFDAVGLIQFNNQVAQYVPPRSRPSHFQHIVHGLETLHPQGVTRIGEVIGQIIERLPNRGMFIMVSDLLARDNDLYHNLKLIRSRGLEALVFHILHPDEVGLPFEGDIVFESLEDDPEAGLDPDDIREAYRGLIQSQIQGYTKDLGSLGVDYLFLDTSTPLDQALSYYLLRRKKMFKR